MKEKKLEVKGERYFRKDHNIGLINEDDGEHDADLISEHDYEKNDENFEDDSEHVIHLNKTRRAFIPEYLCGVFLILLYISFYFNDLSLPLLARRVVLIIGLSAFFFAEISRKMVRYEITPEKMIITHGVIRQRKKSVHFNPLGFVPDINVHQGVLQRLLNYGDVFIEGSGQHLLEIKEVSSPHRVLKILEDRIELNRNTGAKRKRA